MLRIYNTLTKNKEIFTPINPNKVGMYVCGSTVYDYCHIGHGRVFVVFDVVARYLRYLGYSLTYVRNITDIDDKIIKRALELNENFNSLTQRFIDAMHTDEKALGVLPPDVEPRVTNTLPEIIAMIQILIDKGFAYVATNGDVYFEVSKFVNYGELAQQELDTLQAGARIDVTDLKRAPLDFVLWKAAKPNEPSWQSPWGNGRPGWHIECSAMAKQYLGPHIDIHGGGADLQFPHHQNELAQSEAANSCKFVNYWMHLGFVTINKEKMSKSLGNFFTIKEVLKEYQPEVLRYFYIASHYRSPVNYSHENLDNARAALQSLYLALRDLPNIQEINPLNNYQERFIAAMNDDFNTPEALVVLFDLAKEINKFKASGDLENASQSAGQLKKLAEIFGILQQNPEIFLQAGISENAKIEQLINARNQARKDKNWAEADRIRNELQKMQIVLEDTPKGTVWRKD